MTNSNGATATLAATDAAVPTLHIRRLNQAAILVPIIGTAPLIMNKFSAKAKRQMLDAMQGRKSPKEPKDPERDFRDAAYLDDEGGYGMPSLAFKSAIVEASRFFDKSVSKVLLRQALFVRGVHSKASGLALVPITAPDGPIMREDVTRVGISGTDLRYRPEFSPWSTVLPVQYVSSMLTQDSVLSLIEAAGMGCGVGEWRPERSGDFGTFAIDPDRAIESVPVEAIYVTRGAVLAELLRLYTAHGTLNPDLVVDAARPADSVLHDKFEWDDDAAAEKYRRAQASELIRSVKIQPIDPDAPSAAVRAFVSVRAPSEPSSYVPTDTVTDLLSQQIVLSQMRRDIDRLTQRYAHLAEFWTYLSGKQQAA